MKKLLVTWLVAVSFWQCKTDFVEEDPYTFTADKAQDLAGLYYSITTAIKNGLDAHQKMAWAAGLVGGEEIEIINEAYAPDYAIQIAKNNKIARDNTFNRTIVALLYQGLAMIDNGRQAVQKNEISARNRAFYLANLNMMEGMAYADMARYYEAVIEYKTNRRLTPTEARTKGIGLLTEAANQFKIANSLPPNFVATERTLGLFLDGALGQRFCNSYITAIYFDAGDKSKAAEFIDLGYTLTDVGKEIGIINQNSATTNNGIYAEWRSGVENQINGYSQKFIDNRILADTLRRKPANWFTPAKDIPLTSNRLTMNYFYPQAAFQANPVGSATLAVLPLITWQELLLMKAELGQTPPQSAIESVLTNWKVILPKPLSTTQGITLSRVARYEYVGRGRRWLAVGTFPRWEVAKELE